MAFVRPHPSAAALALALAAAACNRDVARPLSDDPPPCLRCHGGFDEGEPARSGLALVAPPLSTRGATETSDRGVGAHRQHLVDGTIRRAAECNECHVVPTQIMGHFGDSDIPGATVTFGGQYGRAQLPPGVEPRYDPEAAGGPACSNVYCHGATLTGGTKVSPVWTRVDGSQKGCDSCHGYPPPWHLSDFGADAGNCVGCHPGTLTSNYTIDVAGGMHIDGVRQGPSGGTGCEACHPYPPPDAIHATHTSPISATGAVYGDLHTGAGATAESYDFGCGECHPTTPASHYVDAGASGPDVDLLPPVPPVEGDEVKRRNDPGAAYDPATRTCTGVYCHSSGQEIPAYATTPPWNSPPAGGLGCDGCHGNPPKYASGGAGALNANSHVFFDMWGWESGHFAGLPGPAHNSKHGDGNDVFAALESPPAQGSWGPNMAASPITCQTCHFETVDPANVLAGRFFYFDTTGVYRLPDTDPPGGDPSRFDAIVNPLTGRSCFDEWRGNQCTYCHGDGSAPGSLAIAPAGFGKVLPLRHVNGRRDVVFDSRTAYDATAFGLPALPQGSVLRPYYMTDSQTPLTENFLYLHPDAQILNSTPQVLSLHLANASYNAESKTCSNLSCHLESEAVGTPLVWGGQSDFSCPACHNQ